MNTDMKTHKLRKYILVAVVDMEFTLVMLTGIYRGR
jgi:hypothetical protein